MTDERETDFKIDWDKHPALAAAVINSTKAAQTSLQEVLREARADGVKFIKDVKSEELHKAYRRGQDEERAAVAAYCRKAADSPEIRSALRQGGAVALLAGVLAKIVGALTKSLAEVFESGAHRTTEASPFFDKEEETRDRQGVTDGVVGPAPGPAGPATPSDPLGPTGSLSR